LFDCAFMTFLSIVTTTRFSRSGEEKSTANVSLAASSSVYPVQSSGPPTREIVRNPASMSTSGPCSAVTVTFALFDSPSEPVQSASSAQTTPTSAMLNGVEVVEAPEALDARNV